eukprot:3540878-Rhodomonas_salina.1
MQRTRTSVCVTDTQASYKRVRSRYARQLGGGTRLCSTGVFSTTTSTVGAFGFLPLPPLSHPPLPPTATQPHTASPPEDAS